MRSDPEKFCFVLFLELGVIDLSLPDEIRVVELSSPFDTVVVDFRLSKIKEKTLVCKTLLDFLTSFIVWEFH